MFIHQREHTLHQIVAAFVLELPQIHSSHMPFFICVTSGAAQRTLPRNLNRERRPSAAQDALPSLNDFARLHKILFIRQLSTSKSAPLWLDAEEHQRFAMRCGGLLYPVKEGGLTKSYANHFQNITMRSNARIDGPEAHQQRKKIQT
jgi:hypothetical protein